MCRVLGEQSMEDRSTRARQTEDEQWLADPFTGQLRMALAMVDQHQPVGQETHELATGEQTPDGREGGVPPERFQQLLQPGPERIWTEVFEACSLTGCPHQCLFFQARKIRSQPGDGPARSVDQANRQRLVKMS